MVEENLIKFEEIFSPTAQEIFQQMKGARKVYNSIIQEFAITLHFYSPKAYRYLRKFFRLPHPNTIRYWASKIDGEPGFTTQSFVFLKRQVENSKYPILCSLMFDEMSIRKEVRWNGKYFDGYVDYGTCMENKGDNNQIATSALVFMVVAINGSWKLPIGYFFVHGTPAWLLDNLVKEAFHHLQSTGVRCIALICDGLSSNISMAQRLGVIMKVNEIKSIFPNPANPKENVAFILDVCHMIKLIRNMWEHFNLLINKENGEGIFWSLVVLLNLVQEEEGLSLANKLSRFHIRFHTQKMKVKLAVQTISASVASALMLLKRMKVKEFLNCDETVNFITITDMAFDILNSRNPHAKGYKAPINNYNKEEMINKLLKAKNLMLNLTDNEGNSICKYERKTGPLGFAVAITSVLYLVDRYVNPEGPLKYLPTYKLSQDHLELFFCTIRQKGGWNNNPTVQQFKSAYKNTFMAKLEASKSANVLACDATAIPNLSEMSRNFLTTTKSNLPTLTSEDLTDDETELDFYFEGSNLLRDNIIHYVGGFVVRKLYKQLNCDQCKAALEENTADRNHSFHDYSLTSRELIHLRNRGGLIYPSNSVIKILQITEKCIRSQDLENQGTSSRKLTLKVESLVRRCLAQENIFTELNEHLFDQELGWNHHINILISNIIQIYTDLRLRKISKNINEKMKRENIRKKLTKLILFQGQ